MQTIADAIVAPVSDNVEESARVRTLDYHNRMRRRYFINFPWVNKVISSFRAQCLSPLRVTGILSILVPGCFNRILPDLGRRRVYGSLLGLFLHNERVSVPLPYRCSLQVFLSQPARHPRGALERGQVVNQDIQITSNAKFRHVDALAELDDCTQREQKGFVLSNKHISRLRGLPPSGDPRCPPNYLSLPLFRSLRREFELVSRYLVASRSSASSGSAVTKVPGGSRTTPFDADLSSFTNSANGRAPLSLVAASHLQPISSTTALTTSRSTSSTSGFKGVQSVRNRAPANEKLGFSSERTRPSSSITPMLKSARPAALGMYFTT